MFSRHTTHTHTDPAVLVSPFLFVPPISFYFIKEKSVCKGLINLRLLVDRNVRNGNINKLKRKINKVK